MKRTGLALTLWLLALPAIGRAADAVFKDLKGTVMVKPGGEGSAYAAKKGAPLYFWDQVETGPGAIAHIAFNDGATVLVKENAKFRLRGDRKNTWISFQVGEFLIGLKRKLAGGEKFQIRTPAAAASVRGTLFWGLSEANKDSTYACFANEILIEAEGKSVLLEAGQKVKIPYGQAPEAAGAADVPVTYLDTFDVDGGIQGLKDLLPK
jgi:hypothetical protein